MLVTNFLIVASLLIAGSIVPLWRVGRSLATRALLIVGVPLLTIAIYVALGRPDALDPPQDADRVLAEQRTAGLAARLGTQPEDAAGWRLLARSYERLRRFDDATRAYRRLVALRPDDAEALIDLSDARSMTQGGNYMGEPIALARAALALDPANPRALAITANEAAQRDDFIAAIADWERIRALVAPDSEIAGSLAMRIDEARQTMAAKAVATRTRSQASSPGPGS